MNRSAAAGETAPPAMTAAVNLRLRPDIIILQNP